MALNITSKKESLNMILALNTTGIKINQFPQGLSIPEGLEKLAQENMGKKPIYAKILTNAKDNLNLQTWQGMTSKDCVTRGTLKGNGFLGNYRLAINGEKACLIKLKPWHYIIYAPKSPQFF